MSSLVHHKAVESVLEDLQNRSRDERYMNDPVLWAEEVLKVQLWTKQKEILESLVHNKKTAVKSCHAIGKLQPISARVPTPTGMRIFGDLQVGDYVLDVHGNPTQVTYVTEDQYHDIYDVTFDDGSVVEVGLDHLWQVQDLTKRRRKVVDWRDHWDNTTTVDTRTIMNNLHTDGGQYRWRVPIAGALQRPHNDSLPLDPYTLGVWLGDGTSGSGVITGGETKRFYADLSDDTTITENYSNGSHRTYYRSKSRSKALKDMGLLNNKHIPDEYLWNTSESQRRALLAGIMDSDGFVGTSNGIDLTNKRLSDDVMQLLHTLGVKASRKEGVAAYTKNGERIVTGTRYRISFTTSWNPFRNRGENWTPPKTSKHTLRTISSVELSKTQQASRCITVDNDLACYLTGREFIPTHNTFISAVAACWWVSTRPNSMVRSTAPTYRQVHELLWEEIRKFHAQHKLVGRITQSDEWKRDLYGTEIQVGSGSKPADGDQHGFHGVHRPDGVLVILDEACGVPQSLFTASDAITTGEYDRVLAVGNPDDPATEFGEIFKGKKIEKATGKPIWNLITVSAFDTPNFTGEWVPEVVAKNLIRKDWVEQRAAEWGEDSSRYKAKILAEFPDQSSDAFFSQKAIDMAYDTEILPDNSYVILGVDIAGYGDDDSVAVLNRGGHVRIVEKWSEGNAVTTAKKIVRLAMEVGAHEVRVDGSGIGSGIVDIMAEEPEFHHFTTVKVMGGNAPKNSAAHLNARAEHYDTLRALMISGKIDLDPDDIKVKNQLLAIKYMLTSKSSIQIESKRDMRSRGVDSPDELDAIVYATLDSSEVLDPEELGNTYHDPLDYLDETPDWLDVLPW